MKRMILLTLDELIAVKDGVYWSARLLGGCGQEEIALGLYTLEGTIEG